MVLRQQPHPEHPQSDPEFVLMINDTNTVLRTAGLFYSQKKKKNTKKQCLKHNRTSAHLSTDPCLCPFVNVCFHFIKVSFKK